MDEQKAIENFVNEFDGEYVEHYVDLEIGPYKFRVYFTQKEMAEKCHEYIVKHYHHSQVSISAYTSTAILKTGSNHHAPKG